MQSLFLHPKGNSSIFKWSNNNPTNIVTLEILSFDISLSLLHQSFLSFVIRKRQFFTIRVLYYWNKRYKNIFVNFQLRIKARQITNQHLLKGFFIFLAHLCPLYSDIKQVLKAIKQNDSTSWRRQEVYFLFDLGLVLLEPIDGWEDCYELSITRLNHCIFVHEFNTTQTVNIHYFFIFDVFKIAFLDLFLFYLIMSPLVNL